jgi:hypothetical protein
MTDAAIIDALSDRQVIAMTIWGESRGLSGRGRRAVGAVILNRAGEKRFGADIRSVCLKPWAFSCWKAQGGAKNYRAVLDQSEALLNPGAVVGPVLLDCLAIADEILAQTLPDTVDESTHYLTRAQLLKAPPAWTVGQVPACEIDGHLFYSGIA